MRPDVEEEVRSYLKDLKDEKRYVRELFDKVLERFRTHEREDEGRHLEILERLSGLNARATIGEIETKGVKVSLDKIEAAVRDMRVESDSWRVPLAEVVQDRKKQSSWARLWRKGTVDIVVKVMIALVSLAIGAGVHHAIHWSAEESVKVHP